VPIILDLCASSMARDNFSEDKLHARTSKFYGSAADLFNFNGIENNEIHLLESVIINLCTPSVSWAGAGDGRVILEDPLTCADPKAFSERIACE
jgi:hypothetical protein